MIDKKPLRIILATLCGVACLLSFVNHNQSAGCGWLVAFIEIIRSMQKATP
jgi:hypothetical protein